ncbi:hypothetical protein KEM52_004110 [Ascosphaera acerosa]|nr:hypothetical protein KEM52_004110 [Ascosphaera acerosa]
MDRLAAGRAFHCLYVGSYACLAVAVVLLTLATPGDLASQSMANHDWKSIFIITGVYIVTLLACIFVYTLRVWTSRRLLAEIPRAWIPIDKPDVALPVHEHIAGQVRRSAYIAQSVKPHNVHGSCNDCEGCENAPPIKGIKLSWGDIAHSAMAPLRTTLADS